MDDSAEVPRYLFRTFSPGSDGTNNHTGFHSMAKTLGKHEACTLNGLVQADATRVLANHVRYMSWSAPEKDDILISFTSSLLFALQHGIRKIHKHYWITTTSNCYLTILDTSRYPKSTFKWTPKLLDDYGLHEDADGRFRRQYHHAEYLVEYELLIPDPEAAVMVPFATLIGSGKLYDIVSELDHPHWKGELVRALIYYRSTWYTQPTLVTESELAHARAFARCFGRKWFRPMMIWVLAMKAEHLRARLCWDTSLTEPDAVGDSFVSSDKSLEHPGTVKELSQWTNIMRAIDSPEADKKIETKETSTDSLDEALQQALSRLRIAEASSEASGVSSAEATSTVQKPASTIERESQPVAYMDTDATIHQLADVDEDAQAVTQVHRGSGSRETVKEDDQTLEDANAEPV